MFDNQKSEVEEPRADIEAYVPPKLEVLGTVEQITQGPDPGIGDVPVDSVISF